MQKLVQIWFIKFAECFDYSTMIIVSSQLNSFSIFALRAYFYPLFHAGKLGDAFQFVAYSAGLPSWGYFQCKQVNLVAWYTEWKSFKTHLVLAFSLLGLYMHK